MGAVINPGDYLTTPTASCAMCGGAYTIGAVHTCPPTTWKPAAPMTITYGSIGGIAPKDINWRKYTPADPPEDGSEYLVVVIDKKDGSRFTLTSPFNKTNYSWPDVDCFDTELVVTHYAKIELP